MVVRKKLGNAVGKNLGLGKSKPCTTHKRTKRLGKMRRKLLANETE